MMIRHCPRCGQSIYWAKTTNGTGVPLNIKPIHHAITVGGAFDTDPVVRLVEGYQIHLDTCPGPAPKAEKQASRTKQASP